MDIILELKNIKHSFTRDNEVLKDISLQVNRGEIITILGPSGCGKTTLLRIIAGLEEQSAGTVSIDNELVSGHLNHVNTEERNIGLVVQERALFPHLSIVNNVKFGIKGTNKNNTERAMSLLKLFSVERYAKNYPHEISSGEQQRVALARSIISQPDLLLLDEPFSSLDLNLREEVRDETLHLLQKSNISVIIVTHDPFEAMFISNHINIFDKSGSIVQSGTPNDLYNNPKNSYVTGFFGETNKFEGVVKESHIYPPVGKIKTPGNLEGEKVVVHIRPQGVKLNKQPTPVNGIKGTVMASKLMGSFSFIHLSVLDNNNEVVHVHSHMPADFNPKQSSAVEIEIDNDQAYIFKN